MIAPTLPDSVRDQCLQYDVLIDPQAEFTRVIAVETPVQFKAGSFDIDLVGAFTYLGDPHLHQGSVIRNVGVVGRFCSIAGNVSIGPPEHPTNWASVHGMFYSACREWNAVQGFRERNPDLMLAADEKRRTTEAALGKVQIGNDVWIGEGAFIRGGVTIGDGAIIGARAVVTKDVPPYAIVVGSSARIIRYRFEPDIIENLLDLQWWSYGLSALEGVNFMEIDIALWQIMQNIESGRAQPYLPPVLEIGHDEVTLYQRDFAPSESAAA